MKVKKECVATLTTEYEEKLQQNLPFAEYPRPQLRRDSYLCLNGMWNFYILQKNGEKRCVGDILVPFVPESRLSGVECFVQKSDRLVYERSFVLPDNFKKNSVVLHVGACDQVSDVFVNEKWVGSHFDGYLPLAFDITKYLSEGENHVKIVAVDALDKTFAYGKQSVKSHGMWYTKISGIWQTVWLESLPKNPITKLKITPDLRGVDITVFGGVDGKIIKLDGKEYTFVGERIRIDIENPRLWTPEDPFLYDFEVISGEDSVRSYFGLRTVGVSERNGKKVLLCNGKPTFFHGLLDQGYYSDGIFLPATPQGFVDDILRMKACGFNTLRKHIKLEPELFYYYCDKYGMFVFQDMINSGKYSFFWQTALPTLFLKRGIKGRANNARRQVFEENCRGIIEGLYNHPSVVYYTIFNEGWGQFDAPYYYRLLRNWDRTRIYDSASGWFKTDVTDVESDHVYFKPVKVPKNCDKPWVVSEFGGYSCKVDGHVFRTDKAYGYKTFDTCEGLQEGFEKLYREQILPAIDGGLCGCILTQVSDVEEEINGLLTYDRRVLKVRADDMQNLANDLYSAFSEVWRSSDGE